MSRKPGIATLVVCLAYAGVASVCAQTYPVDRVPAELVRPTGRAALTPPVDTSKPGDGSQESEPENPPVVVSASLPVGVLDQGQRKPCAANAPRLALDRKSGVAVVVPAVSKVDVSFEADFVSLGPLALLVLARPLRHHAPPVSA